MNESQNHAPPILPDWTKLAADIQHRGQELGFQKLGISDTQLDEAEVRLRNWLQEGKHGRMDYMSKHGTKRSRPAELEPGTVSVISARLDYLPPDSANPETILANPEKAYISRYALGRDYHKVLRNRLQKLATYIEQAIGPFGYRVFTDSAPVMEKALAEKAGLGWIGKHSNLLAEQTGSWFFLGEIYTDLPLPTSLPANTTTTNHCGTCTACMDACPTRAIVAPYQVDARLCISYLTIELRESIPVELRPLIGNRIYGCDDCQLVCPWNRFAQTTLETDTFCPATHWMTSACWNCLPGVKKNFSNAPKAALSGVLVTHAGYAISPSHWAMPRPAQKSVKH